ncbi:MAG: PadR family transcriptional regulator [Nocardioides sp.]
MLLRHALLVLLAERPQTGYELARRMSEALSWFWSAQHSQIYPELAALERDGLITVEVGDGPGPRGRRTCRITERGRADLRAWMTSEPNPRPVRDELVLRAFGASSADPAELAQVFGAEIKRLQGRLDRYDEIRREIEGMPGVDDPSSPAFGWLMSLEHGIASARARQDWASDCAQRLRAGAASGSQPTRSRN